MELSVRRRREAHLLSAGLMHWYGLHLHAERQMRRAARHFGVQTTSFVWEAWKSFLRSRSVRNAHVTAEISRLAHGRELLMRRMVWLEWKVRAADPLLDSRSNST